MAFNVFPVFQFFLLTKEKVCGPCPLQGWVKDPYCYKVCMTSVPSVIFYPSCIASQYMSTCHIKPETLVLTHLVKTSENFCTERKKGLFSFSISCRKRLNRRTVPLFKRPLRGSVATFKLHPGCTVPPFKIYPGDHSKQGHLYVGLYRAKDLIPNSTPTCHPKRNI